jgi:hypothetical protein
MGGGRVAAMRREAIRRCFEIFYGNVRPDPKTVKKTYSRRLISPWSSQSHDQATRV